MSIESIDDVGEGAYAGADSVSEQVEREEWNGRDIRLDPKLSEEEQLIQEVVNQQLGVLKEVNMFAQPHSEKITKIEKSPVGVFEAVPIIPCGEKVDGEVSIKGEASSEGKKSVEAEVRVESKDGNISGSVSGGVSQDKDGNTEGKVKAGIQVNF